MAMKCPSCQFEQSSDRADCECCGLIFEKWNKRYNPAPIEMPPAEKTAPASVAAEKLSTRASRLYQQIAAMDVQEAPDGKWVYFPWGSFGKGYDGEDLDLKKKILRYVGLFSCVHCPTLALLWTLNFIAWLYYPNYRLLFAVYFLAYLGASYGWFWTASKKWVSSLAPSSIGFNQAQYLRSFRMVFHWKHLVGLEVLSLLLLMAGIWMWLTGNFFVFFENHPDLVQRSWLMISGLGLTASTYLIYFRNK